MVSTDVAVPLGSEKRIVEAGLKRLLDAEPGIPARLRKAMKHSLLGGGKRLRPILTLWTWDAIRGRAPSNRPRPSAVVNTACALEMLHTYSLIHDDLPAMDDDDLRRGHPTCHVVFGEATAILAGDGLQALAMALLARNGGDRSGPLVDLVANAVGPAGMVGGQQDDLDAEGAPLTGALIRRIHLGKTARLLAASMEAGALLAGATVSRRRRINRAGIQLGLAFQGSDDLLDVTGDARRLGKTPGKDAAAGKATWVRLDGIEAARRKTRRQGQRGIRELISALPGGAATDRLAALARLMWDRDH